MTSLESMECLKQLQVWYCTFNNFWQHLNVHGHGNVIKRHCSRLMSTVTELPTNPFPTDPSTPEIPFWVWIIVALILIGGGGGGGGGIAYGVYRYKTSKAGLRLSFFHVCMYHIISIYVCVCVCMRNGRSPEVIRPPGKCYFFLWGMPIIGQREGVQ